MVSKKIAIVILILGILLIVASVAIALSSNMHKVVLNSDSNTQVKPDIESGKVAITIEPPPKVTK